MRRREPVSTPSTTQFPPTKPSKVAFSNVPPLGFTALFKGRISDKNLIMATGESVAHLNYLVAEGEVIVEPDADDVLWYKQA